MISHTVSRFNGIADTTTVIGHPDELDRLEQNCGVGDAVSFVAGGSTRQQSVHRGLESLSADPEDIVLVHDGARPLLSQLVIKRCIDSVLAYGTAIAALPVSETLKRATTQQSVVETIDREGLWSAQTPQAAMFKMLCDAYRKAELSGDSATDDSSLLERAGQHPRLVLGARENIKITTPEDLEFAEQWLARSRTRDMRIGFGYDVHRLEAGRKLILGGVYIPAEVGLLGHSDADVALHAICDALLGAAGQPDIGHLFPNTDPTYAGADSAKLLQEVAARIWKLGYHVGNVDCCIIAEAPRISPHAPKMRSVISRILKVSEDRVSIKATTNEGIGSLGRGEGMACHATATIFSGE